MCAWQEEVRLEGVREPPAQSLDAFNKHSVTRCMLGSTFSLSLWPEKSASTSPALAIRFFKTDTTIWREKADAVRGSCVNSLRNAETGHIASPVAARIIRPPGSSTSVLLSFKRRIAYWSPSANEMYSLVSFVSLKVSLFKSASRVG